MLILYKLKSEVSSSVQDGNLSHNKEASAVAMKDLQVD